MPNPAESPPLVRTPMNYKKSIKNLDLPLKELALAIRASQEPEALVTEFAKRYDLLANDQWFFPQMLATIAEEVSPTFLTSGKASTEALYREMIATPRRYAYLQLATYSKRSQLVRAQLKSPNYSALVPLVLAAFKQYHNLPYSRWDTASLGKVVEKNLADAMLLEELPEIRPEEILQDRAYGLMFKSGAKQGDLRPPETTYTLYLSKDSKMHQLPMLAKIMLCQTWCAHPSNRNNMMVLDPLNWDKMPSELVSQEVLLPELPEW